MARARMQRTKHGVKFTGGRSRKGKSGGYGGPAGRSPIIRRSPST